jgi:plastocyanin
VTVQLVRPVKGAALALLLVAVIVGGLSVAATARSDGVRAAAVEPAVEDISISATSGLRFAPSSFSVTPGATVHLTVTQDASFNHTFTLSSVRNATIPSGDSMSQLYDYFHNNSPIVNITLGTTAGKVFTRTFTAPAVGKYEFICIVHFSDGMIGTMTSTTSPGSPTTFYLSPLDIAFVGVAVVAAIVAVVVVLVYRRKPPATKATPRRGGR